MHMYVCTYEHTIACSVLIYTYVHTPSPSLEYCGEVYAARHQGEVSKIWISCKNIRTCACTRYQCGVLLCFLFIRTLFCCAGFLLPARPYVLMLTFCCYANHVLLYRPCVAVPTMCCCADHVLLCRRCVAVPTLCCYANLVLLCRPCVAVPNHVLLCRPCVAMPTLCCCANLVLLC